MQYATVLCVDDDAAIRNLYLTLLKNYGYGVVAASSGHLALQVFRSMANEIDAVILDYNMPEMNGLELARSIKGSQPTLPVLMISASPPELEEMAPFVDAALPKGASVTHILSLLDLLIAKSSPAGCSSSQL